MSQQHGPVRFTARDPALGLILLLFIAVAVGGGGIMAALANLIVQLAALALLALHGGAVRGFVRGAPIGLRLLTGATLLLPLLQLVPLPPAAWLSLPGRDMVAASQDLAGGRGWFPLSLDPARTLLAATGLIAPVTVLVLGLSIGAAGLAKVQRMVIAAGIAAAFFGAFHLLDARWGDLYAWQRPLPGILVGTFADRNGAALFFDGCLLLLAGLPSWPRSAAWRGVALAGGAFLVLAVVLTGSRTGMALLALPALLAGWRALSARWQSKTRGPLVPALAGAIGLVLLSGGLVTAVGMPGRIEASLDRFGEGDEMRAEMREDALFAARHYWPAGAGMGAFDEVFQADESLEYVSPRRAGHAHMDYMELAIEAGVSGLLLLACWSCWIGWYAWLAVRRTGAWAARAAGLFLIAIAAQSLLSFPLRSQAMLCMAAFALVLIVRSPMVRAPETVQ